MQIHYNYNIVEKTNVSKIILETAEKKKTNNFRNGTY